MGIAGFQKWLLETFPEAVTARPTAASDTFDHGKRCVHIFCVNAPKANLPLTVLQISTELPYAITGIVFFVVKVAFDMNQVCRCPSLWHNAQ